MSLRTIPRVRILSVLTLIALGCASLDVRAQILPREQLQALLEETSKALQSLVVARSQKIPSEVAKRRDAHGHTLEDYQKILMSPEAQSGMEALETAIRNDLQAGDLPGAQFGLIKLRSQVKSEMSLSMAFAEYWGSLGLPPPRDPTKLNETLRAHGIEPPHEKEIESLRAQFDRQIAAREFRPAIGENWPRLKELNRLANVERAQQILTQLDNGRMQDLLSSDSGEKCVAAKGTTGSNLPNIRPNSNYPEPHKFAPRGLRGKKGSVQVFVVVDAKGCPERAVVVSPSEHVEFDRAALNLAMQGSYLPAEKEGTATRAGFVYTVSFDS